jgi:hypothetical protein
MPLPVALSAAHKPALQTIELPGLTVFQETLALGVEMLSDRSSRLLSKESVALAFSTALKDPVPVTLMSPVKPSTVNVSAADCEIPSTVTFKFG